MLHSLVERFTVQVLMKSRSKEPKETKIVRHLNKLSRGNSRILEKTTVRLELQFFARRCLAGKLEWYTILNSIKDSDVLMAS